MLKRKLFLFLTILISLIILTQSVSYSLETSNTEIDFSYQGASLASLKNNYYSQPIFDDREAINLYLPEDTNYSLVKDNGLLRLYVCKEDLSIKVVNIQTGYIWSSTVNVNYNDNQPENPLYSESNKGLNTTWKNRVRSAVRISYYKVDEKKGANTVDENLFPANKFTYLETKDGFISHITFIEANISFDLIVEINDYKLSINIPFSSIEEDNYLVSRIIVYPFFGAVKGSSIPGYIFIPDGSGTLKRFSSDAANDSYFSKKFYGDDYGLTSFYASTGNGFNEELLVANLYGAVHGENQNGFINIIKKGAEYANMVIYSSGDVTDFYYYYAQFTYRNSYAYYLNKNKTISIINVQDEIIPFDILMEYSFLSENNANYVGMAKEYQNYLLQEGYLKKHDLEGDIPLNITSIGGVTKDSLFFKKKIVMTKVEDLVNIVDDLKANGINNNVINYLSWYKGDHDSSIKNINYESRLGSKKEFKYLNENYNVFYDEDYVWVNTYNRGYSNNDVVYALNDLPLKTDDITVLNSYKALDVFSKNYKLEQKTFGLKNVLFSGFEDLMSDFRNNKVTTRQEVINNYLKMTKIPEKFAVYYPYNYLYSADELYNVPTTSTSRISFSDTVPFTSIVVSGYTNMYSKYLNFYANIGNDLLRNIEYNIYPSVILTKESSYLMNSSNYRNVFSSEYSNWKDTTIKAYKYVSNALSAVRGHNITQRIVLDYGVTLTVYDNNKYIIVNYSNNDYNGTYSCLKASYKVGNYNV
ncbi:MAG: DUF5696 domain-containing protein [Acholeplasmatales bacterium]|nr:DUF5696 domain-containing protein [Acholeplasmatales bacterium]